MRSSRVLSITIPQTMLDEAQHLARKENRTMSELVREALRYYQRARTWDEMATYGRTRAEQLGVHDEDVVPLVHEFRREQRAKGSRRRSAK